MDISEHLLSADVDDPNYASTQVDALLRAAQQAGASDVHLQPTGDGLKIQWRIDGVLQPLAMLPSDQASKLLARLKVLAKLLTYQSEVPQEGRIRAGNQGVEMRVATFPTLHGERVVVRIFAGGAQQFQRLNQLALPDDTLGELKTLVSETAGAILVTGPAGCGKTTTAYACLREEISRADRGRSLVSLEDPIEVALEDVSQSQVNEAAGFDMSVGLRSLMRQDPEVIFVGEIRDPATARIAFQAALTGQLLLTTFHAPSAAGAISRLLDMGIEPYVLRSSLLGIVAQRLVRRLCDCRKPGRDVTDRLDLPVREFHVPAGCPSCRGTGYRGRLLLAEMLPTVSVSLADAILNREDTSSLQRLSVEAGMVPLAKRALAAVESGQTSPAEVRRIFGTLQGDFPSA